MSQQWQWCFCIVRLNIQQLTHRHCSKLSVASNCWYWQWQSSVISGHISHRRCGISWDHYSLDCLSGLNSFIPCVCTVTYLSFLKIQTTNGYLLQEAWQLFVMHMYRINNTRLCGTFHGIHRSRETGCDKHGVIIHISIPLFPMCWGCCQDQCGACSGSPQ